MNQSINFLLKLERITSATEQNERDSKDNDITDNITALETCEYESVWHFINEEKSTDTIEFWCNELPWRSLSASIIYIIINGWAWTASGSMLLIFFLQTWRNNIAKASGGVVSLTSERLVAGCYTRNILRTAAV